MIKYKWVKVGLITIATIVLTIVLAGFIVTWWFSPILSKKLNQVVQKASDGLYHVEFAGASINLLQGQIMLNQVQLKFDSSTYHQQQQMHTAPNQVYQLQVKRLELNHVHLITLWLRHKLIIGDIILNAPNVRVLAKPDPLKATKPKDNRTLYEQLSKSLKLVQVGNIALNQIKLRYENHETAKPAITAFKELNIKATDLLIDSATQYNKQRFLFCRNMDIELQHYRGRTAHALYGYQAKSIKFSTQTRQLQVDSLTLTPLYTPAAFFSKTYEDRFVITARKLLLNHFDFNLFDKSRKVKAKSVILNNGQIKVFSNPRINPKSFSQDKAFTFPNQSLRSIPFKLDVDSIIVKNYDVIYTEHNTQTKGTGTLSFNRINGHMTNVTTDANALKKNHYSKASFNAHFLNHAPMRVNFAFNLVDSLYSYSYNGWAGPIAMPSVNQATVPLASLKIQSGVAKRLAFAFKANRSTATGQVTLLYNDLKIQLLKADTASLKMRKLALVSLLANTLILKNNNPDQPGQQPRTAHVVYQRPKNYPFFATLWRTLLMGIKPCAGLDFKTQRDADIKLSKKEKKKFFKKQKKEAKKKRKEEKHRLKELEKARKKALKQ
ncbi:hypothetical protein [Mucilaginibacter sp. CSA2-8R]|uniref:hypothetical protein n=1 Tax=Mucilaginibacter sp. CSA2-8R TaxID=3141542 RepID=UPI00315C6D2A